MGIEVTIKGAKRSLFEHLTRVDPGDMTGQSGKLVAVKGTEDGLELIDAPSGSGLVDSVFGRIGAVVKQAGDYDAADITETATKKIMTDAERAKLAGVEASATADQTDAEIETAYNNRVPRVSAGERTAGTETADRRFSPADIATMAGIHGGGGGGAAEPVTWYTTAYDTTIPAGETRAVTVAAAGAVPGTHVGQYVDLPANPQPALMTWSTITANDQITVSIRNTGTTPILVEDVAASYTSSSIANAQDAVVAAPAVATVADLATARSTYVRADGYYSFNDGGEGLFKAIESGDAVDGGHVFAATALGGAWRYHRCGVSLGIADAGHFGLRLSGDAAHRTTNTDALQRAVDYLAATSAAYYGGGFRLKIRKGAGAGYIDDEITVTTFISRFQMVGEAGVELIQYTANKGFLIFTKNEVDTDTSLHRHILIEHIRFEWQNWEPITNVRSNVFAFTNAPDGSGGMLFGFVCRHCEFARGRRVFTAVEAGQPDAHTAGAFFQSVTIEHCRYEHMSGALYKVSDVTAGGPQLTIRNINAYCGYTVDVTRTKRLAEEFIYVNHAIGVILDQIENLGNDREFCYIGACKMAKISNIQIEDHGMADATHLIKINSSQALCTVENLYLINSTIPADRWIVGTYQAHVRLMGGFSADNTTHTGDANLYVAGRYGGSTGIVYWDALQRFDNATDKFTRSAADASNVIDWVPTTITQG